MAKALRGIIPAVITPFTPDDRVDEPAFRKVVNFLIDQGVHGLFPAGTGGEFSTLSLSLPAFAFPAVSGGRHG